MLDYLQKFNDLPKEVKDLVSTPKIMDAIDRLEQKYGISLASTVIRIVVKEIGLDGLEKYFIEELNLDGETAQQLNYDLKVYVLKNIINNLENIHPVAGDINAYQNKLPVSAGANFFFSPEDEEEIRKLTKQIDEIKAAPTEEQILLKVDEVVKNSQINFGSQDLVQRFKKILGTYFRGIRNRLSTKEAFIKPFNSGGLEFDSESAESVMAIAENIKERLGIERPILPPKRMTLPEDEIIKTEAGKIDSLKNIGARDMDYDLSSLKKRKEELKDKPQATNPGRSKKEDKPVEILLLDAPELKKQEPENSATPNRTVAFNQPKVEGKVRMDDIKISENKVGGQGRRMNSAIMGPVDELRYMDLVNFRRLAANPKGIIAKIKEKIDLLEDEDYSQKIEGIKAWRMSLVNSLYLEMGNASISQGKAVNAIIEDRKSAGQEFLSKEEFEAIMDLNKSLRF